MSPNAAGKGKQSPGPAGAELQEYLDMHIVVLLHLLPELPDAHLGCPGAQTHLGQDGDLFPQMTGHRK